jgi:hypothetical protein
MLATHLQIYCSSMRQTVSWRSTVCFNKLHTIALAVHHIYMYICVHSSVHTLLELWLTYRSSPTMLCYSLTALLHSVVEEHERYEPRAMLALLQQ